MPCSVPEKPGGARRKYFRLVLFFEENFKENFKETQTDRVRFLSD